MREPKALPALKVALSAPKVSLVQKVPEVLLGRQGQPDLPTDRKVILALRVLLAPQAQSALGVLLAPQEQLALRVPLAPQEQLALKVLSVHKAWREQPGQLR